jgi:hypothetical protein
MRHVSHLRRSAIVCGFSHRFRGGLSCPAPTALAFCCGAFSRVRNQSTLKGRKDIHGRCGVKHVSHLRRSAIVCGFSHRFRGGLSCGAPTALGSSDGGAARCAYGVAEVGRGVRRKRGDVCGE